MMITKPSFESDVYLHGMCIVGAMTRKNPWSGYSNEEIRHFLRKGEAKVKRQALIANAQWELVQQMIKVSSDDHPDVADVLPELERFTADEQCDQACPYLSAH